MEPPEQPSPRRGLSRRDWGVVAVLAAVNFAHVVDFVIVMPLGGQLMRQLEIEADQFAWVVSAYGLASAVAGVLVAGVLDRFDRKRSLLFNFGAFALATLLCGLVRSYEWLVVARALAGAFGGLTAAGLMAIVGDRFEDARRGTATGAVMSAFALASIFGLPAGLELADHFGWAAPFLAVAGLSGVLWAVAAAVLPAVPRPPVGPHGREPVVDTLARVGSHPDHLKALSFMGLVILAAFVMIPFLGPYIEGNLGLQGHLSAVYATAGACTLVSMNIVGRVSDRVGKQPVFTVMAVLFMLMILAVTNLPPVGLAGTCAVAALFMVAGSGRMVPAQALVIGCVRPADRGAFLSLNSAVQSAALGAGAVVGGLLVSKRPDGGLDGYPMAGAVAFALTGLTLVLVRTLRPSAEDRAVRPAEEPAAEPVGV